MPDKQTSPIVITMGDLLILGRRVRPALALFSNVHLVPSELALDVFRR